MALLLLVLILAISFIAMVYAYFKSKRRVKQLAKMNAVKESHIQQLRQSEQSLQQAVLALQNQLHNMIEDPITHLLGWQLFMDRLNHSLHESARYQLTMGILSVDINEFNMINEALGYRVGDALLQEVSKRLQLCIRQIDSLSRFSKDVFFIMLIQLSKPETAAIVAQRILQSLAQPIQINEHTLYINACVGISIYPNDGQDAPLLLRNADLALQLAKEKGHSTYQFYQEKIHLNSQRELALSTGLKRESLMQELEIYYQPIMNVQNKTIFCMEALLYWRHPELGLIGPQELFNYAEKQGKLNIISDWLLKNACLQFLSWRSVGFQPELLSIPLSIRQLENSRFIYGISQSLQELHFKPEWLLFGIKESSSPITFDGVEKAFNMLKYLNIKIAIEDFGSRSLSISYLKNMSVNYLKLDRCLISDIEQNESTQSFIKAMVLVANTLSMQLIVQGVGSEQQMTLLNALGCHLLQGPWIGAAVPAKEVLTAVE